MSSARSEEPVLSEAEGTYAFRLHYVAVRQNEYSFVLVTLRGCDFFLLRPYFLIRRYSLTFVILTLSEAMRKDLCISLSLRRCSPTRTPSLLSSWSAAPQ